MNVDQLIQLAKQARMNSYAPYSGYRVGAVVESANGVYTGCNVENASYGSSICAERTAVVKAIFNGDWNKKAIAIVGGNENATSHSRLPYPCGICRQFLSEFAKENCPIYISTPDKKDNERLTLGELLPFSFAL